MKQRLILLTGGIGSGKSAAGQLLAERGALIIDADIVGHGVLRPGSPEFDAVAERWPEVVLSGEIDRRALGRLVFADHAELRALEEITHPAIRRVIRERIDVSSAPTIVVEVPIAQWSLGDGWTRVVVDAPDDLRIARLRERGLGEDEISSRMSAQPSGQEWRSSADHILDNSGTLDDLDRNIDALVARMAGA